MRNLKITLDYDGSKYRGWQKQKNVESTIQGKLEATLSKITGEEIQVIGCGRTDTGVHAKNYIANFHCDSNLTIDVILNSLNEFLPEDIVVTSMRDAKDSFHARFNAKKKTYVYTVNNNKHRSVFSKKYQNHFPKPLNLKEMKSAANVLVGTHDFQSFTSLKINTKPTTKTVNYISILEKDGIIEIKVNGDSFLLNMVRIIAGTLLEVGIGKLSTSDITRILGEKKRPETCPVAEAKGLCLLDVEY